MKLPRIRSVGAGLAGLLLSCAPAFAQQATPIEPLHVVRLQSPAFQGIGYVSETGPSSMRLFSRGRNDPVTVPFASISELDLRRERTARQGATRGAKLGAAGGAAAFVAAYGLGLVFGDAAVFRDVQWGSTAVLFVGAGAAGGAAWGALKPGSRWERVPPPVRLQIVR